MMNAFIIALAVALLWGVGLASICDEFETFSGNYFLLAAICAAVSYLFILVNGAISAGIYSFILKTSGYAKRFKRIYDEYIFSLGRILLLFSIQILVEIFAEYIPWGSQIANALVYINMFVYAIVLTKYLPGDLNPLAKLIAVLLSLSLQIGAITYLLFFDLPRFF